MFGMGWQELTIIFVIVLVIFGPKSLPKIGQALGKGIREFKDAAQGLTTDLQDDDEKPRTAQNRPTQQVPQPAPRTIDEELTEDKTNQSA